MKKPLQFLLATATIVSALSANAQVPFAAIDSLDINNIKVGHNVHGGLWHDNNLNPMCEFPKGSGKHLAISGGLWMGGYNNSAPSQLQLSAYTYGNGHDYWPGTESNPPGLAPLTYAESQSWAKIWKLRRTTLDTFLSTPVHTLANTPKDILEWPAKGNPYAKGANNAPLTMSIMTPYAPYVEVGGNANQYNALDGDYPLMKGDMMLWNLFTDYGPTHDATNGTPLQMRVSCLAYAYKRNSAIDNVIFYEYETMYEGMHNLDSFVLGLFADLDIGNAFNDYVAFDSSRNLAIFYNGSGFDAGTSGYQDSIPMAGIKILKWNSYDTCGTTTPAGSAMYFDNSADPVTGDPSAPAQYYNYMTHRWRNGSPLTEGNMGYGGVTPVKYVYTGSPDPNLSQWSECAAQNPPGDRKMVLSSQNFDSDPPYATPPGSVNRFAFALVASSPALNNGCPSANFTDIRAISDTAEYYFCNPPIATGINDASTRVTLPVYPNPAQSVLNIDIAYAPDEHVQVYDALGRTLNVKAERKSGKMILQIQALPSGVYFINCYLNNKRLSAFFVKE